MLDNFESVTAVLAGCGERKSDYRISFLVRVAARCLLHIQTKADPIQSCAVKVEARSLARYGEIY